MEETKRKLNCTYCTRGHILKVHIERLPIEGAYEEVNIVVNDKVRHVRKLRSQRPSTDRSLDQSNGPNESASQMKANYRTRAKLNR